MVSVLPFLYCPSLTSLFLIPRFPGVLDVSADAPTPPSESPRTANPGDEPLNLSNREKARSPPREGHIPGRFMPLLYSLTLHALWFWRRYKSGQLLINMRHAIFWRIPTNDSFLLFNLAALRNTVISMDGKSVWSILPCTPVTAYTCSQPSWWKGL